MIGYAQQFEQRLLLVDVGSDAAATIELPAEGYPERPFVAGPFGADRRGLPGGSFVFLAAGEAWIADPVVPRSPEVAGYTSLGAVTRVIPSDDPRAVWLIRGNPPDTVEVQLVDIAGGVPLADAVALPPGTTAIAPVRTAPLLLQRTDGAIQLFNPANNTVGPDIGVATAVLDTHGSLIAWLAGPLATCGAGCPLHLTDIARGEDRVIDPPEGSHGWIEGGGISPDGTALVAFVDASPATGSDGFGGPVRAW